MKPETANELNLIHYTIERANKKKIDIGNALDYLSNLYRKYHTDVEFVRDGESHDRQVIWVKSQLEKFFDLGLEEGK